MLTAWQWLAYYISSTVFCHLATATTTFYLVRLLYIPFQAAANCRFQNRKSISLCCSDKSAGGAKQENFGMSLAHSLNSNCLSSFNGESAEPQRSELSFSFARSLRCGSAVAPHSPHWRSSDSSNWGCVLFKTNLGQAMLNMTRKENHESTR